MFRDIEKDIPVDPKLANRHIKKGVLSTSRTKNNLNKLSKAFEKIESLVGDGKTALGGKATSLSDVEGLKTGLVELE